MPPVRTPEAQHKRQVERPDHVVAVEIPRAIVSIQNVGGAGVVAE